MVAAGWDRQQKQAGLLPEWSLMGAASGIATTPELNDTQFWVRVGPAHGPQEIAQWRQSAAATIKWHLFSVNMYEESCGFS